jgi:hypothetical protein
MSIAIT